MNNEVTTAYKTREISKQYFSDDSDIQGNQFIVKWRSGENDGKKLKQNKMEFESVKSQERT